MIWHTDHLPHNAIILVRNSGLPYCFCSYIHLDSTCNQLPSACRVDAVQLALSSLTTIPPQEQILLLNGNPLDPNKSLGVYQLPLVRLQHKTFCLLLLIF